MTQLIPAICPKCGANVQISDSSMKAHCEYCGMDILVSSSEISLSIMITNFIKMAKEYYEKGLITEAIRTIDRAYEIDPRNTKVKNIRKQLNKKQGDTEWNEIMKLEDSLYEMQKIYKTKTQALLMASAISLGSQVGFQVGTGHFAPITTPTSTCIGGGNIELDLQIRNTIEKIKVIEESMARHYIIAELCPKCGGRSYCRCEYRKNKDEDDCKKCNSSGYCDCKINQLDSHFKEVIKTCPHEGKFRVSVYDRYYCPYCRQYL